MRDEMTLTLNSPITEEQWDAITDVDFEHTDRIWFNTKHGKSVEFIKKTSAPVWIPCSERLPEEDGNYLIWFRYKSVLGGFQEDMAMEYYADSTGWDCDNVEVIAWQPLPEPYTEDSNGG